MVALGVILMILFFLGFWMYGALIIMAMVCFLLFGMLFAYTICSIFYYIMGKEAGFDLPWIAFFPGGKNYIAFTIPHREFNVGIFSTFNRKLIFWIWFVAEVLVYLISAVGSVYIFFESDYIVEYFTEFTSSMSSFPPTVLIIAIILITFLLAYFIARSVIHWRKNYDLLKTYGYNKAAVIVPTLNLLCPLVMMVFPLALAGRLPEYGADGYYPVEEY